MRRCVTLAILALAATGCRSAAVPPSPSSTSTDPVPDACDGIRAEYMRLVKQSSCAADADCSEERQPDPQCFTGVDRINPRSQQAARIAELGKAFGAKCPVAPCDPPITTRVTRCESGVCATYAP
jgi:hypothetical protein